MNATYFASVPTAIRSKLACLASLWVLALAVACNDPPETDASRTGLDEAAADVPEVASASSIRPTSAEPHVAPELEFVPLEPASTDMAEAREAIRAFLERAHAGEPIRISDDSVSGGQVLLRFYEARDFAPAFYDAEGRPRSQAIAAVMEAAGDAPAQGLRPEDYHHEALTRARSESPTEPHDVAAHDLLLTDSFVTLATHSLRGKVDPLTIHPTWTARQRAGDVLEILRAGLAEDRIGEALASTTPGDPGYTRLTEALARYRALEESRLPDVGDAPWDSTPERLSALRRHLDVRGDLEGDDLDAAIRRFQRRHGLAANGEIDPPTLEALRIPIAERVEKLRVNLERWRWLPEDLGERQVRVNIAGFDLRYVEGDEVRLRMRAIVGKSYRKTPVFSDTIRYLVLNPTWTVPSTIFREDLLPEVRRDSRTLERRGLEVLSRDGRPMDPTAIEWRRVRHGDLYFRQPPGPNNALGPVKLMFPNPYDVYLHGTPRQDLFEEPERAFSSGCIRLERPLELAALLTRPPGAPRLSSTVQSS